MVEETHGKHGSTPAEGGGKQGFLIQQLVSVERVSFNLSQSVVVTTEDKLRLCLQTHLSELEKKKEWIAPLSLLVSLLLTLLSANFRDAVFPATTWQAIFLISAVLSLFWLMFTMRNAFKSRSIESLINEIRSENGIIDKIPKSGDAL